MKVVEINIESIKTWDDFHDEFFKKFNFPDYYGRNMNAWIDCMDDLTNNLIVIDLGNCNYDYNDRNEFILAILECSSFVNYRRIEREEKPFLLVSKS